MGGLIHWRGNMKKVIILTLLLLMITSSLVFAAEMTLPNWYTTDLRTQYPYAIYNGTNTWLVSNQPIIAKAEWGNNVGLKVGASGYYGNSSSKFFTSTHEAVTNVAQSSHDIINITTSTVFFSAPMTPFQRGMVGALPNLLQSLLVILPIILGMLVLVIGFRKAWEMLSRVLARA